MSLTSDELNYLIWRYFQEHGLEVASLALLDESAVADFDARYGNAVPIGSLVNIVQKGLLYTQADKLVTINGEPLKEEEYGEKMTLFHALGTDASINGTQPPTERFEPLKGNNGLVKDDNDVDMEARERSPEFIKVMQKKLGLGEPVTVIATNTASANILAYGLTDSRAKLRLLDTETTVILNHPTHTLLDAGPLSGDVTTLAWNPNGDLLVTGVESGELRLWTKEGSLRNVLSVHQVAVITTRWSPDGSHILTTDADNVTILWDSSSGNVVQYVENLKPETPTGATPAPLEPNLWLGIDSTWTDDQNFVIPGLNGSALVFHVGDRTPIGTLMGHSKPLSAIKFNKGAQLLATASDDRTIRVWNGANFNFTQVLLGHSQPITYMDWLNDRWIISCGLDATIRVWEVTYGSQLAMALTDGVPIVAASLSPDHKRIAVGTTEGIITVFDIVVERQVTIKNVAEYQPDVPQGEEENNITGLEWDCESATVCVGYSHAESVIVSL